MKVDLNKVLGEFDIESKITEYGDGHINDTYCTEHPRFILQRINTDIFKNPDELMENIENVTAHIKDKLERSGKDPERGTLTVVKTRDNKPYIRVYDMVFRVYKFIENTVTVMNDKRYLENAGKGFGEFQNMLSDFPIEALHETIKDFHNTPERVRKLKKAIEEDRFSRKKEVIDEINFALEREEMARVVVEGLENKSIPKRVTHNDTKMNNILFDKDSGEAVCVIDLDTVMPGSVLYDFGDAMRIGASTAPEDEPCNVSFDTESFELFTKGFLSKTKSTLNEKEIMLLPFSAKLLTYETGVRFLTDYLNGDTYFKTHYKGQNKNRTKNQFKLVKDIEKKQTQLEDIVKKLI